MQSTETTPVSKKFYPLLVAFLVLFLIFRFSPLLLDLFLKFKPGSLPPTGIDTPPVLLGVMIAIFLGVVALIHQKFDTLRAIIERNPKKFLTAALVGMVLFLAIAKAVFTVYTDEKRDVFVANIVAKLGVATYSTGGASSELNGEEASALEWARSLHPAGHYLLALLVHGEKSSEFWRFLYGAIPLMFVMGLIWLWKPMDEQEIWFVALVGVLILSFAYFRNYVLVRTSNELIPALGMTCYFLMLFRMMRGNVSRWIPLFIGLCVAVFISVSAKYSAFVTWGAALIALGVLCAVHRNRSSLRFFLFCLFSGILGIGLHVYLWVHSDMLLGHRDHYGVKILKVLGIAPPEWMHGTSGLEGGTGSIPYLILGAPVWFGPFLFGGFLVGIWVFLRRGLWRDSTWLFLVVMLLANLIGVMAVNPRAAYLSPAVLPLAVFCAMALREVLSDQHRRELVFVTYAFVAINILILTLSS
jgi:hypothetical protein